MQFKLRHNGEVQSVHHDKHERKFKQKQAHEGKTHIIGINSFQDGQYGEHHHENYREKKVIPDKGGYEILHKQLPKDEMHREHDEIEDENKGVFGNLHY